MGLHIKRVLLAAIAAATAGTLASAPASASYGYYVGKNLTEDGSVLIGGTGEEVSSHWLEIVPAKDHPAGATISVGVTQDAAIPGELIEIPQVPHTFKYMTMNYSDYMGFPAPLTNGGLNEHKVAIRDIWSNSRRELVEMTKTPQHGVQYSDAARIALERATTAREAAEIIGGLVDEHGWATYGGNSHMIADPDEGWVVLQFAGSQGLWVAERLGPDDVRVSYPGYIGDIPDNYLESPDYMGSENLISFAVEQGWYDPNSGEPFNVHEVYGEQGVPMRSGVKYFAIADIEQALQEKAPVTVEEFMRLVRDPRIADEEAGYGHVVSLRRNVPVELTTVWIAPTSSVTTPFIPWYFGATDVPPEFGQHRYLSKNAGSTFLDPDFQEQEATVFAGRVFKRLLYYTCSRPEEFLPEVRAAMEGFERKAREDNITVSKIASTLYESDKPDLAESYLNFYSQTKAMEGLRLGEALLMGIEARTKWQYGIRRPEGSRMNSAGGETPNCLTGHDPDTAED